MDYYRVVRRFRRLILTSRAVPKTVFFNLCGFPLSVALKFPAFVSHRYRLMETRGPGSKIAVCSALQPFNAQAFV